MKDLYDVNKKEDRSELIAAFVGAVKDVGGLKSDTEVAIMDLTMFPKGIVSLSGGMGISQRTLAEFEQLAGKESPDIVEAVKTAKAKYPGGLPVALFYEGGEAVGVFFKVNLEEN